MKSIRIITPVIVLAGFALAASTYLAPVPSALNDPTTFIHDPEAFHTTLAFVAFNTCLNLGAVWLFLLGLRGFTTAFRHTYHWICIALAIQGLGSVGYLVALYVGAFGNDVSTIMSELPLATGSVMIFYGLVRFARLLRINNTLLNPLAALAVSAVVLTAGWLLPHLPGVTNNEFLFDLGHSLALLEFLFYGLSSLVCFAILATASRRYQASMRWFVIGLLTAFGADVLMYGIDYLTYPAWLTTDVISLFFIVTNACSVVAAYMFHRISQTTPLDALDENNLVNSIVLLASFVSRPSEVEPALNNLRRITAARVPGSVYTVAEVKTLGQVYSELENYLVEKEPLRKFGRQELKDLVQERYSVSLG